MMLNEKPDVFDPQLLISRVRETRGGFLLDTEVEKLAACGQSRLWKVLVRCGAARFICATQDVATLVKYVKAGGDYVRDVGLLVGEIYR